MSLRTIDRLIHNNHIWHMADAKGQKLGTFASRVAVALSGKYKPVHDGSTDIGDYVVIKNAAEIELSGRKEMTKTYWWHTRHMGSERTKTYDELSASHPNAPLKKAIYGMLPKNDLRRHYMQRLYIFSGPNVPKHLEQNILHTPTELMTTKYQNVPPADSFDNNINLEIKQNKKKI